MALPLDREVAALAREISELGSGEEARVFRMSWWSERMLTRAMADPAFRTELFRFVDVFPATTDSHDVLEHLGEYFRPDRAPRALRVRNPVPPRVHAYLTHSTGQVFAGVKRLSSPVRGTNRRHEDPRSQRTVP